MRGFVLSPALDLAPASALAVGAGVLLALLLWAAVRGAWRRYRRRRWASMQRNIAALRRMTWQEFEHYAAEAFRLAGWSVTITGGGGADDGADLILCKGTRRYVVQCKHYKARVGAPVVREAVGVAVHFKAGGVYVVALGGFTKAAKNYALGKRVKLIDGPALLHFMNRSNTRQN